MPRIIFTVRRSLFVRIHVPKINKYDIRSFLKRIKPDAVLAVSCVAVLIAAHCTYMANGFIWLDHGDIEDGRALVPLSQWMHAFLTPFASSGFYRPAVTLFS